ncbi:MAG: pallilysin-related adhesin [Spirochaetaceae bacterium]|nr:pallilysin-related adhesin [Spirochaetaceae bacterium]
MAGKALKIITTLVFIFTALGIGVLVLFPGDIFHTQDNNRPGQPRVVIPQINSETWDQEWGAPAAYEDTLLPTLPLEEGETAVAVLAQNFDADPSDEYIIACRSLLEAEGPIHLIYIDTEPLSGEYQRIWSTPTAATRPGGISLFAMDILGDQGICVLLRGMNGLGEETLTVLKKVNSPFPADNWEDPGRLETDQPFSKIAELGIDGSISILETGRPCSIAAYGRDFESSNALDRVEIIYTYNPATGMYEQSRLTKVPGAQVEQRRIQELLSGHSGKFEQYIEGLWYFVNSQGQPEQEQCIYFDYAKKEVIFYGDELEQIFIWQNSIPTRYGLYLSTQNSSVTTLKRFIVIELESLDNLRIRVTEDVQLKIGISAPWDGVYRRAESFEKKPEAVYSISPHIEAAYVGSIGRLTLQKDGTYELYNANSYKKGKYAFYILGGETLLELRPQDAGIDRDIYQVHYPETEISENDLLSAFTLTRIRLSTRGIQSLHEPAIFLTLDTEKTLTVSTDRPL